MPPGGETVKPRSYRLSSDELAAEIEAHLAMQIEDNVRRGMSPDNARRAAALTFGSVASARESWRDQRVLPRLDAILRDLRVAVRALAKRPGFTTVCILTLALAVGANVAIFGLIDRVLLRPLDVPDPSAIVTMQRTFDRNGVPTRRLAMTWEQASRVREMSHLESAALASASLDRAARRLVLSIDASETTEIVDGQFVTAGYFRVLGVRPALGRDFEAGDDTAGAQPVVILSHRYWRARFDADPAAIGRTIRINESPAVVVGVAPRTFRGTELDVRPPDVFLPLMTGPRLAGGEPQKSQVAASRELTALVGLGLVLSPVWPIAQLTVIGRIAPGGERQAEAELAAIVGSDEWTIVPLADTMLPFGSRADVEQFLFLLAGAVGLTLLIGCANLAGLLLARTEERRSELAIRGRRQSAPAA